MPLYEIKTELKKEFMDVKDAETASLLFCRKWGLSKEKVLSVVEVDPNTAPTPVNRYNNALTELSYALLEVGITELDGEHLEKTPGGQFISGRKRNIPERLKVEKPYRFGGHECGSSAALFFYFRNAKISDERKTEILVKNGYPPFSQKGLGFLY